MYACKYLNVCTKENWNWNWNWIENWKLIFMENADEAMRLWMNLVENVWKFVCAKTTKFMRDQSKSMYLNEIMMRANFLPLVDGLPCGAWMHVCACLWREALRHTSIVCFIIYPLLCLCIRILVFLCMSYRHGHIRFSTVSLCPMLMCQFASSRIYFFSYV